MEHTLDLGLDALAAVLWAVLGLGVMGALAVLLELVGLVGLTRRRRGRRWPRRVVLGGLLLGLSLAAADRWAVGPVLRVALGAQLAAKGIEVDWSHASGRLSAGRVVLQHAHVARTDAAKGALDLEIAELTLDLDLGAALDGDPRVLERLVAKGVKGTVARRTGPRPTPRRPWTVAELRLEDAQLTLRDPRRGAEVAVRVDRWVVHGFRRSHAAYDLLFRAEGQGHLGAGTFAVRSSGDTQVIEGARLPVQAARPWLGRLGPLIDRGELDLRVEARAPAAGQHTSPTRWRLSLARPRLRAPDGGTGARLALLPLNLALRALGPRVQVRFDAELDHARLEAHGGRPSRLLRTLAGAAVVGGVVDALGSKGPLLRALLDRVGRR